MSPLTIILSSLTGTSLLVALALATAWRRFGREPHAALWATGFAISGIGYLAQLVGAALPRTDRAMTAIAVDCLTVSMVMLAIGFRCRAGMRPRAPRAIAATVLVAAAGVGVGLLTGDVRLLRIVTDLIACGALLVSGLAVRGARGSAHVPSAATMRMLFAFAGYCALAAGLAAAVSADGPVTPNVYGFLMLVGMPSGMVAIGLGTLLLLAGDLATRLYRLAEVDPLTGLLNRRGVERAAPRLIAQAARGGRALSVVVADLDRFKAINDRFGHALGDVMLRRFADHAAGMMRASDLIGRLGGEEFVFVLADTDMTQAADALERLRAGLPAAIADLAVPMALTASFGVTVLEGRDDTLAAMIARADAALYRSKDDGRDRISVAPPPAAAEPRFLAAWLRDPADAPPARKRGRIG